MRERGRAGTLWVQSSSIANIETEEKLVGKIIYVEIESKSGPVRLPVRAARWHSLDVRIHVATYVLPRM